jgi:hypothetical protein
VSEVAHGGAAARTGGCLCGSFLVAALFLALPFALGVGPCGAVPGGHLEAPRGEPPERWTIAGGQQCLLEVGPADPTSVKVDCYAIDGALYVHTHRFVDVPRLWGEAWANVATREPDVRIVVEGRMYELRAHPVREEPLRTEILASRGFDPVPAPIRLFRLDRRPRPGEP